MKRLPVLVALLPLLLAACDNKPAAQGPTSTPSSAAGTPVAPKPQVAVDPTAASFQHDPALDVFGYYFTETAVRSGNWKLKSVNMGSPSDFASWEDGKRPSNFGPFFLEFEDVTSPTAQNELGQVYHTASFRLQPDSYTVGAGQVTFHGSDLRVGEVAFSGGFDLAALQAAKSEGPSGGARTVLTGSLTVGAERIGKISFLYFAGD